MQKINIVAPVKSEFSINSVTVVAAIPGGPSSGGVIPGTITSLTWITPDTDITPTFRAIALAPTTGDMLEVEASDDTSYLLNPIIVPYVLTSTDISNGFADITFPSFTTGTRPARARINGGNWTDLTGGTFTINAPVSPTISQSSLAYEFIAPDKVTLIPAASDWAANQISNLSMSTSNTFPVGVNTETKSIILTQTMVDGQATTGMQFTRSGGTYYAKHWRTLITGGVSVDSPILTVTVPQDLTMAYLDGQISPRFNSSETVLANTFTVAAVPTGKRRYAFVTWSCLGFTTTVPTISAASIGGTSVTPTASPYNSNSIQNYAYYALVEIPTGTSIPVTGTVSQSIGRAFISIQIVTCPLGSAVSVDSATGASNTALAVSSTAGAIPTGGMVLGVSSEYFASGTSTAGHTETWTGGNTVDVVAFDTPTVAARIYFASISHGATAGSVTATTTPGTVTINAHGIITAVLKAT